MEIVQEISRYEVVCHKRVYNKNIHTLHWHERYEICWVLKNSCRFRVDGEEITASVGDIVAVNENVVHQFIIENDDTCVRIFQLPIKLLMNFKSSVSPLKTHIKYTEINETEGLEEKLNMLFSMMEKEEKSRETGGNSFLQGLAVSAYFLLERHFPESAPSDSKERDRQEFYRIIEYVNNHFKEDITAEGVAGKLYISRGRLTSVFKKYAGEGMGDYVNKLRVKNANWLLSKGKTVTEAAFECGFQSIRTFNNVYKNIMNMTPSEYIKNS